MIMKPKKSWLIYLCILSITISYAGYRYYYKDFIDYRVDLQDPKSMEEITEDLDYNLEYIHNNVTICQANGNFNSNNSKFLINMIHSTRSHFELRRVLRNTWGSQQKYANWILRSVFILGSASYYESPEIEKRLMEEISANGDIIMGHFTDTYRNLTYKHLLGYKWMVDHCPMADAVLKNDDDVFVNMPLVVQFLSENLGNEGLIHCWAFYGSSPSRGGTKWIVSREEYPFDVYPDYCTGAGYLTTMDVVKRLYGVSRDFRTFWIDDAFITGILRTHPAVSEKVSLKNVKKRVTYYSSEMEKDWNDNLWFVIIHEGEDTTDSSFKKLWEHVTKSKINS